MKRLLGAILCVGIVAGCGKDEGTTGTGSGGGAAAPSKYGTPEDTAKTMLAACVAGDWTAVGECCSKTAPGIDEVRDNKLSEGEKASFKTVLGPAKLGETTKSADGKTATVKFTATKGDKTKEGAFEMVL